MRRLAAIDEERDVGHGGTDAIFYKSTKRDGVLPPVNHALLSLSGKYPVHIVDGPLLDSTYLISQAQARIQVVRDNDAGEREIGAM